MHQNFVSLFGNRVIEDLMLLCSHRIRVGPTSNNCCLQHKGKGPSDTQTGDERLCDDKHKAWRDASVLKKSGSSSS